MKTEKEIECLISNRESCTLRVNFCSILEIQARKFYKIRQSSDI